MPESLVPSCQTVLVVAFACLGAPASSAASSSEFAQQSVDLDQPSEARRWNVGFLFGGTSFSDSDTHRTLGATFRVRLAPRWSIDWEFGYSTLSPTTFETSVTRTERKHSDVSVAGRFVYDFGDEAAAPVVPYLGFGAGVIHTRNEITSTPIGVDGDMEASPPGTRTTKTSDGAPWLSMGFGVRILIPGGLFVSPELTFGGTLDRVAGVGTLAIKVGYGF